MRHLLAVVCTLVLLCLAVACDKAPSGVIPESKMEDLIVDLEMADAYIEMHWDQFPDDSSRLVLKQSVFMKHEVTPELYDTSLVWYARNMDVYVKVYDNVIGRLKSMREQDGDGAGGPGMMAAEMEQQQSQSQVRRSYAAQGDSADIWEGARRWILAGSLQNGFITFDFDPDKEYAQGDRYELQFKLKPLRSNFMTFVAVDYSDGSTSVINQYSCNDGWNAVALQSDSTRTVKRVYGYIKYRITRGDIAYVDSLLMLRTHRGPSYGTIAGQRLIERNKRAEEKQAATSAATPQTVPQQSVPAVTKQPQGSFKPKEGVNKSSASKHVTQSPNSRHMPQH